MAVGNISKVSVSNIGTTSMTISWPRPVNATKYKISVRDNSNGNKVTSRTMPSLGATGDIEAYSFTGLTPLHAYEIEVLPYSGSVAGNAQYYRNSAAVPMNTVHMKPLPQQQQPTPPKPASGSQGSATNDATVSPSAGSPPKASSTPPAAPDTSSPTVVDMTGKASVVVPGLQLNQSYTIQIVAQLTLPDGSVIHSPYARAVVKTPSKAPATDDAGTNSNYTNTNSNSDLRLDGGSIFVGSFGPNTGAVDIAIDSPSGSGIILNKTGLAGLADGVKEFYIDARTGKAYFAGNVTAGTVKIGPNVDPTGTKTGIYINASNYWYQDGTWSARGADIAGALVSTTILKPFGVTNIVPTWGESGFKIAFTSDPSSVDTNNSNQYLDHYEVTLTGQFTSKVFSVKPVSGSSQSFTLSVAENRAAFGLIQHVLSGSIVAVDSFGNKSNPTSFPATEYFSQLPKPVLTVASLNNSYSVKYTTPTNATFSIISIEEIESDVAANPIFDEPPTKTLNVVYTGNSNPAVITTSNINKRWVRARFYDTLGATSVYSDPVAVTPTSVVNVDLTPPNEVTVDNVSWSGDNIVINYTLPSADPGIRFVVALTSTNLNVGYFYFFPSGSSSTQSHTITKTDLFNQFGTHYSQFSGVFRSIDSADNRTNGTSFNVPLRVNSIAQVTPTFSLTALSNGYSVSATNYSTTPGVNYMEVYAKHTPWTTDPTDDTNVVYAGPGVAVIIDDVYTPVYVKIHYYDDFGNTSLYSVEKSVTPLNPGAVTSFENPISFGQDAVIYAGGSYSSGKRVLFKSGGIFAYDGTNTTPSTQIISDAADGTPTFITKQAQIADWNITDTKIQNDLAGTPTSYTGLSATGTYSFWAGSATSGGDANANFSVTPSGKVSARDIVIYGNGNAADTLLSASNFTIKGDGGITAISADISGKITATSGDFSGNVSIGTLGSLYSGTVTPGSGSTPPSLTGQGFILNKNGIRFNSTNTPGITTIDGTTGKFFTQSADIGGWLVNESSISKTSGSGTITLDSSNAQITVGGYSTYSAGIASPTGANASDTVIWAGPSKASPAFKVTADGSVYMTGSVTISGYATSTDLNTGLSSKITGSEVNGNVTNITNTSINTPSITGGTIKIGSGSSVFKADSAGIYLGNETFASAPFRVTPEGAMTATSGYIGGTSGWIINPTKIISSNSSLTLSGQTGIITSTGVVPVGGGLVDVGYTETLDDGTTVTTNTIAGAPTNTSPRTLTITPGYIKSDSYLTLWSTNAFEVFQTAGTNPLLSFDVNKSIITSTSLVVGKAITATVSLGGVPYTYDDRYNSDITRLSGFHVNGFARVRNATPTGPKTTGYFRNIYIGTSNNPGSSTGFEGAVYMQY